MIYVGVAAVWLGGGSVLALFIASLTYAAADRRAAKRGR